MSTPWPLERRMSYSIRRKGCVADSVKGNRNGFLGLTAEALREIQRLKTELEIARTRKGKSIDLPPRSDKGEANG
jgi:hypothetical protein